VNFFAVSIFITRPVRGSKSIFAVAIIAGIAFLAGCGGPTTAADIDRIMAQARSDAAVDLAHARSAWGGNAAAAGKDAMLVEPSADLESGDSGR
jgi:hypothetical protein